MYMDLCMYINIIQLDYIYNTCILDRRRERKGDRPTSRQTLSEQRIFILQVTILSYENRHKELPKCYFRGKKGGGCWNVCRDRKSIFSTLFWTLEKNGILHLNCHLQGGEQSRWSEWVSFLAAKYTRETWTVSESSRNSSLSFRSRLEGKENQPSWKEICSSWRCFQGEEGLRSCVTRPTPIVASNLSAAYSWLNSRKKQEAMSVSSSLWKAKSS